MSVYNSLDDLLVDQLYGLYDAEVQWAATLPNLIEVATAPELKIAFQSHLDETPGHVARLDEAFNLLDVRQMRSSCEAMNELIKEVQQVVNAAGECSIKGAALIAAAQRIVHYQIAGYGSAHNFSMQCGLYEVAELLQQTLDEERSADQKLTEVADKSINVRASHETHV